MKIDDRDKFIAENADRCPTVDEMVELFPVATFEQICDGRSSDKFFELMTMVVPLFERYSPGDQALALAIIFGMLCGYCTMSSTTYDKIHKTILTTDDRLKLFVAQAKRVAELTTADACQDSHKRQVN